MLRDTSTQSIHWIAWSAYGARGTAHMDDATRWYICNTFGCLDKCGNSNFSTGMLRSNGYETMHVPTRWLADAYH